MEAHTEQTEFEPLKLTFDSSSEPSAWNGMAFAFRPTHVSTRAADGRSSHNSNGHNGDGSSNPSPDNASVLSKGFSNGNGLGIKTRNSSKASHNLTVNTNHHLGNNSKKEKKSKDFIIYPRRKQGQNKPNTPRSPVVVSLEVIQQYYDFPLHLAAQEMGISSTALKKACRRVGIKNWPYRFRDPLPTTHDSESEEEDSTTTSPQEPHHGGDHVHEPLPHGATIVVHVPHAEQLPPGAIPQTYFANNSQLPPSGSQFQSMLHESCFPAAANNGCNGGSNGNVMQGIVRHEWMPEGSLSHPPMLRGRETPSLREEDWNSTNHSAPPGSPGADEAFITACYESNVSGWAAEINACTPSRTPVDIKVQKEADLEASEGRGHHSDMGASWVLPPVSPQQLAMLMIPLPSASRHDNS